jgi:N-acetylglucosaminyldiphosphoundecaprenol N-acetyl-beta-D-mannosaminyltransferase
MTQVSTVRRSLNPRAAGQDRAAGAMPRAARAKQSELPSPGLRPAQIMLMGVPIDGFTLPGLVAHLVAGSQGRPGGYLMTPNLDNMRTLRHDPSVMARAMAADIRVADGMPLIWASRLQGTPLPERVAGSDVIWELAGALALAGKSLFLLGGDPGTAERAAAALTARFPGLIIAGTYCPPVGFEDDASEMTRIDAALRAAGPDFVYIGLPFPKASALALQMREAMPATWFVGLGISFSFVCGDVRRAPAWMQRTGLEWIHRLAQEPRRLTRRYLLEGLPFVARLLASAFSQRRHPPDPAKAHLRAPTA